MPELDDGLLHHWLRRTAASSPDAPAVVEEDRITSFGELLARAEALAATFIERGVRPGDRIALVLPKTTDAIVAVFASLFAGAIYVPVHPRWPQVRIDHALDECGARMAITVSDGPPQIADRQSGAAIAWREAVSPQPRPLAQPEVHAGAPAVILFTSGSTGRPKGVVLSHRAVGAFVKWTAREFRVGSSDRLASPSPLGFDLSTFDVFNMACCGAVCVLVPEHIAWMPRFLEQFARHSRITCWYSVPSILTGMLRDGGFENYAHPDLRVVLFAGEVFASPQVAKLQAGLPHAVFANLYGPTETNVVTWFRVPPGFDTSKPLPVGGPCPYADVRMDPASGELLAGGESIMCGYWNRPEETERALVRVEGQLYYRTGDRVSRNPEGDYLFLGRLDRQVKRRGFRIELGEIEAALARHEAILEAAAVAWEDANSGTNITVFVHAQPGAAISQIDAKAHCASLLPPYMLPDRIVFLDAIPKGSRGKIDYEALKRHGYQA